MCLAPSLTRGREAEKERKWLQRKAVSQRHLVVPTGPRGNSCLLLLLVSRRPRAGRRDFSNKLLAHTPRSQDHTAAIRNWRCVAPALWNIETPWKELGKLKISGTSQKNHVGMSFNTEDGPVYNERWWLRSVLIFGGCENELNKWGCPLEGCGPGNKI